MQDEGMNQGQVRVAGSLQRRVCWQQAPVQRPESTGHLLDTDRNISGYSSELQLLWVLGNAGRKKTIWTFLCFLLNFLFCTGVQPINNAVIVSGEQWRDSATYTRVSILPHTSLPARLPHHLEQSSMRCKAGPWWLPALNAAGCTRPSQTPWRPLPLATISSASVSLFLFCKFICIISF